MVREGRSSAGMGGFPLVLGVGVKYWDKQGA